MRLFSVSACLQPGFPAYKGPSTWLRSVSRYFLLQELGKCHKCGDTGSICTRHFLYHICGLHFFNFIHIMQVIGMFLYFNTNTFKKLKTEYFNCNSHPEILYMLIGAYRRGDKDSAVSFVGTLFLLSLGFACAVPCAWDVICSPACPLLFFVWSQHIPQLKGNYSEVSCSHPVLCLSTLRISPCGSFKIHPAQHQEW